MLTNTKELNEMFNTHIGESPYIFNEFFQRRYFERDLRDFIQYVEEYIAGAEK